ncbi:hypothetical protein VJJ74_07710 [Parvimonas micra]|uniref:hypothetical protein n=2 Tax=Parvimonas TaxID=543311 RepID=UPI002B49BBC9|nr:hypothetical protein [Parvimonas micra]MEB3061028.1 hypothetical protein [Parvimonas micra]
MADENTNTNTSGQQPMTMAEMRAAVAAEDARLLQEAHNQRVAYFKPVMDLVDSAEFATTYEALKNIKANYAADELLSIHINALVDIIGRLIPVINANRPLAISTTAPSATA